MHEADLLCDGWLFGVLYWIQEQGGCMEVLLPPRGVEKRVSDTGACVASTSLFNLFSPFSPSTVFSTPLHAGKK